MPARAQQPAACSDTSVDAALKSELMQGLMQEQKSINPKFFYDERGSQLFEQIMGLPEYYPTRTELSILQDYRADIARHLGTGQLLIEPGAGNCEKVKTLLPALQPRCYIPVDISADFVFDSAAKLQADFPEVDVQAVAGDMHMRYPIPEQYSSLHKVVFYPGSTIGNFEPEQALVFLRHLYRQLGTGDGLLIGVDLHKSVATLNAAYNDRQGITALFNLNVLEHVNTLLGGDFDVNKFNHVAFYNSGDRRIEMHLESISEQRVRVNDQCLHFRQGERIHTEYSYKYSLSGFADLAQRAGFSRQALWLDEQGWFSLQYFSK